MADKLSKGVFVAERSALGNGRDYIWLVFVSGCVAELGEVRCLGYETVLVFNPGFFSGTLRARFSSKDMKRLGRLIKDIAKAESKFREEAADAQTQES